MKANVPLHDVWSGVTFCSEKVMQYVSVCFGQEREGCFLTRLPVVEEKGLDYYFFSEENVWLCCSSSEGRGGRGNGRAVRAVWGVV